ncbi:MAG: prolyl aminopeptidase [Cocleimonas sp.]|nr:prolyl aminopeptidase [Cocleimonas sp.]
MPLYAEINEVISYEIAVDKPHTLYVEECGNPDGIPVIFLHGGPGSGCNANHRRYFNPEKYRIILFDQRGCGLSTPHGCLDKNTTQHLVADIETIRLKLNVHQWVIFAGSWGVTLALLYAQQYKERVLGMILRGAFLASKRDMDWFFSDGVSRIFPQIWKSFSTCLPKKNESETLLQTYHRCLLDDDKKLNAKAALAWSEWTDSIVTWALPETDKKSPNDIAKLIRIVRLETHYAVNQYFLEENYLLENCEEIQDIPTLLIHGQRDITCPVESSWLLHKVLKNSSLQILPNTGHLADEPSMIDSLVDATDEMVRLLK